MQLKEKNGNKIIRHETMETQSQSLFLTLPSRIPLGFSDLLYLDGHIQPAPDGILGVFCSLSRLSELVCPHPTAPPQHSNRYYNTVCSVFSSPTNCMETFWALQMSLLVDKSAIEYQICPRFFFMTDNSLLRKFWHEN